MAEVSAKVRRKRFRFNPGRPTFCMISKILFWVWLYTNSIFELTFPLELVSIFSDYENYCSNQLF